MPRGNVLRPAGELKRSTRANAQRQYGGIMKLNSLANLSILILAASGPAQAGTYVITTLPLQQYSSYAIFGLNDNDQVVGRAADKLGDHGFLWSNGVLTQIDYPAAADTHLNRINDNGLIAGTYYTYTNRAPHGSSIPFTYDIKTGAFKQIKLKGHAHNSRAESTGINLSGTVIGVDTSTNVYFVAQTRGKPIYTVPSDFRAMGSDGDSPTLSAAGALVTDYYTTGGPEDCGSYQSGKWTEIPYPPGTGGICFVSSAGTIFGDLGSSIGYGFIYSNGNFTTYQYPNENIYTRFVSLNASGEILGYHPAGMFVYVNSTFYPLTVNGYVGQPVAINALDSIVGAYTTNSGTYAFIAQCPANQRPCTQ